jgi:hypothetical protein
MCVSHQGLKVLVMLGGSSCNDSFVTCELENLARELAHRFIYKDGSVGERRGGLEWEGLGQRERLSPNIVGADFKRI